jgi:nitrilase
MTRRTKDSNLLQVGLAQSAPVWLDRERTLLKVKMYVEEAAAQGCHLVVFGEALVPGYPFWLDLTDGARFNSPLQKSVFAEYAAQAAALVMSVCEVSTRGVRPETHVTRLTCHNGE